MRYFVALACLVIALGCEKASFMRLNEVSVGMTYAEVKSIAGKPEAIEHGFPAYIEPREHGAKKPAVEWVGQLLQTTWNYGHRRTTFKWYREGRDSVAYQLFWTDLVVFDNISGRVKEVGTYPTMCRSVN